jgi:lipoprotein NlpI
MRIRIRILGAALIVAALAGARCFAQSSDDLKTCTDPATKPYDALPACQRAIDSRKFSGHTLAVVYDHLGMAYSSDEDYDRAFKDFSAAIRNDPAYARAYNDRGASLFGLEDYDDAIKDYDHAIRLKPTYADAFYNRGLAYDATGDGVHAIADYNQAIRLDPKDPDGLDDRGVTQFCSANYAEAQKVFAASGRIFPGNLYQLLWLYLAQARAGDQSAQNNLAGAAAGIDLAPWPGPVVSVYLGAATPASLLDAAKDADPTTEKQRLCRAYFYLGEYALIAGNRSDAATYFEQSLQNGAAEYSEAVAAHAELQMLGAPPKP